MTLALFLDAAELRTLTGKLRSSAQVRELVRLGIPHRVRSDGVPVVATSDAIPTRAPTNARLRDAEPNWSALGG